MAYSCDEGPIFETTRHELASDLGVIEKAVEELLENGGYVYGQCTHPGHHAGNFFVSQNRAISLQTIEDRHILRVTAL